MIILCSIYFHFFIENRQNIYSQVLPFLKGPTNAKLNCIQSITPNISQNDGNSQPQLSDKYDDQKQRLKAAMINLFKYESLLNNEYLIRKFLPDPFNPAQFVLLYEVVQRENSIKHQYVQNELNTRKQYHLILTDILKEFNNKLWNYDNQNLMIRPFFPKERKRVYIKILEEHIDQLKSSIDQYLNEQYPGTQYFSEVQEYLADKKFKKLFIIAPTEEIGQSLFSKLFQNKQTYQIDTIKMEEIDYLAEFHKQLYQKKMELYLANHPAQQSHDQEKQSHQRQPQREFQRDYGQKKYGKKYDDNVDKIINL